MPVLENLFSEFHARKLMWDARIAYCLETFALFLRLVALGVRLLGLFVLECAAWVGVSLGLFYRQRRTLDSKVILITGAANGVGRELAKRCVQMGATVVGVDVEEQALEQTREEIVRWRGKGTFYPYVCDVSDFEAVKAMSSTVLRMHGRVHVLVNNAAIMHSSDLLTETPERITRIIQVDLLAYFWTTKCFLGPMLRAGGGHIVNMASIASYVGTRGLSAYVAAKHGVMGFHECLELELMQPHAIAQVSPPPSTTSTCTSTGSYSSMASIASAASAWPSSTLVSPRSIDTTLVFPFVLDTRLFHGCSTREPTLFPIMTAASVAENVLEAIIYRRRYVYIPRSLKLFQILRTTLPFSARVELYRFSGGDQIMNTWSCGSPFSLASSPETETDMHEDASGQDDKHRHKSE